MTGLPIADVTARTAPLSARNEVLMRRAKALESEFLSQMLGHATFGKPMETFGGGIGEEQFSSLLRDEQARLMVRHGGIGLAEQIFHALVARDAPGA